MLGTLSDVGWEGVENILNTSREDQDSEDCGAR